MIVSEEVTYQGMFCMARGEFWLYLGSPFKMFVKYTKRNKKDIEGNKYVVFWYGKL